MFDRAWIAALALGFCALQAHAQASELHASVDSEAPPPSLRSVDPYQAYAQGHYAEAFEGFANLQVKRPKDIDLMLNIGAALYRLRDFAGAEKAWSLAAEHGDPNTRAQALYDMGNSAFMQQHLEQAVQHYQSALSLLPQDEDAKHNLQLTKKRLEAQKQQPNQDPNTSQDPNQKSEDKSAGDPNQSASTNPSDPNQPPKPQDDAPHTPQDANESGPKPQSHDKSDAQDKREPQGANAASQDASEDKANEDETSEDKPGETSEPSNAKRMPRSQAERTLDAMGESRPRHAPAKDGAKQRPADGMDW